MVELFIAGDPFFMGLISVPLLVIVALALNPFHHLFSRFAFAANQVRLNKSIRSLGLFALMFGLFSQLLGLYGALQTIRVWGTVEAEVLFQGLRVSTINSAYGALIFGLALAISMIKRRAGEVTV